MNSLRSPLSLCGNVPQDCRTIGIERSRMKLYKGTDTLVGASTFSSSTGIVTLQLSPSDIPNNPYHKVYRSAINNEVVGAINPGAIVSILSISTNQFGKITAKLAPEHYDGLQNDTINCDPTFFQPHNRHSEGYIECFYSDQVLDTNSAIDVHVWDLAGQQSYLLSHIIHFSQRSVYIIMWKPDPSARDSSVSELFQKNILQWLDSLAITVPDASIFLVGSHCTDAIFDLQSKNISKIISDRITSYNDQFFPLEADSIFSQRSDARDQIKKLEDDILNECRREKGEEISRPSDFEEWRSFSKDQKWPLHLRLKFDDLSKRNLHVHLLDTRLRILWGKTDDFPIPNTASELPKTVQMELFLASIDNATGEGVRELRGELFKFCNELPFMDEMIPKFWSSVVETLENHEFGSNGILSKDDAISTIEPTMKSSQKLDKGNIWSIIKFYSDVGRIFVRDDLVLRDPGHLIALLNPLVHHEPGTLLTKVDIQQKSCVYPGSLVQITRREELGRLLDQLKRQDTFSLKLLEHLFAWNPLDQIQKKSFLNFFEESNIVSTLSQNEWLVTARVKSRKILSFHDIQGMNAKSNYHAFYLMPIAHPGIIANMLSQILKLAIPYLDHECGKDTIFLRRNRLLHSACIASIEDFHNLKNTGAFSSLLEKRFVDHPLSFCALYIRSSDFGLFQFAFQLADKTLDCGKYGTLFSCFATHGNFPLPSSSRQNTCLFQSFQRNIGAGIHDLDNLLQGILGDSHPELKSLRDQVEALLKQCSEVEPVTGSTIQTENFASARRGDSSLQSAGCPWIKFRSLDQDSESTALLFKGSLSEAYDSLEEKPSEHVFPIPPENHMLILHAYDDGTFDFSCRLRLHLMQRSLMGVRMNQCPIKPIDEHTKIMQQVLRHSSVVFVALTPTYLSNTDCLNELIWALDLEEQGFLSIVVMSLHTALMTLEKRQQLINCGSVFCRKLKQAVQLSDCAIQILERLKHKYVHPFEEFDAWCNYEKESDLWDDATDITLQQHVQKILDEISEKVDKNEINIPPISPLERTFKQRYFKDRAYVVPDRSLTDVQFYSLFPECVEPSSLKKMRSNPESSLVFLTKTFGNDFSRLNVCNNILLQMGLHTINDIRDYINFCQQNSVNVFNFYLVLYMTLFAVCKRKPSVGFSWFYPR